MLSWFTSISSSILLYIIAALVASTLLFGGLFWYSKTQADKFEAQVQVAQDANKTLDKSLIDKTASCDVTDKALAAYQTATATIVDVKDKKLNAIDALPKKPVKATTQQANTNVQDETDVVDIDGKLPSSLLTILQQSSSAVQGSVGGDAK